MQLENECKFRQNAIPIIGQIGTSAGSEEPVKSRFVNVRCAMWTAAGCVEGALAWFLSAASVSIRNWEEL